MKRIEKLKRCLAVLVILCASLYLQLASATAQQVSAEPLKIGPSGQAYLQAKGRRINANVGYFDPTRAAPPLETSQTPRRERERNEGDTPSGGRGLWLLVSAAVLTMIIYLFVQFGGAMSVSLRPESQNPERGQRRGSLAKDDDEDAILLPIKAILRMSDRKKALVLLSRSLLAQVVEGNGLLLQQSWTARDALRRLPGTQPHLVAIKDLVLTSERVQFGNRDISEQEFNDHVRAVSPLLKGAAT